ncbi:hypothetical protein DYB34_006947 [Aphanomyces astaci]|uniref:Uncharacterized protein n=1 Tax=Aphanomyces astaci TaxID=112090 RepID=A0A3R7DEL3_APHAT|nr:hypothetical protein DYB34_006947 [Aphanomyces astaci]
MRHGRRYCATSPRPPVTPVGLLKRKRSATDSPEAPQKPLKRLDVTTRPGGGGGVATADGDMKNDDRIVKLQHEVDALRHENAQLRIESHRWQASHAKEQQPSTQLHEIKLSIDNVAMMVDEKRRYQSNSQSTVNSSQDSPSDLLVNADGHPLSHAALQVELHRASTRLVAAIRKASESSKMAIKSRKAAEADQDALVAAAEKVRCMTKGRVMCVMYSCCAWSTQVADISRAMTRDGANNDSTSSGSATQEDSVL